MHTHTYTQTRLHPHINTLTHTKCCFISCIKKRLIVGCFFPILAICVVFPSAFSALKSPLVRWKILFNLSNYHSKMKHKFNKIKKLSRTRPWMFTAIRLGFSSRIFFSIHRKSQFFGKTIKVVNTKSWKLKIGCDQLSNWQRWWKAVKVAETNFPLTAFSISHFQLQQQLFHLQSIELC